MVPTTKEALRKLVTDTTIEIYEDLTPQLIQMIDQTKHDEKLTEAQKQDEISLHLLGYVKSCTNENHRRCSCRDSGTGIRNEIEFLCNKL